MEGTELYLYVSRSVSNRDHLSRETLHLKRNNGSGLGVHVPSKRAVFRCAKTNCLLILRLARSPLGRHRDVRRSVVAVSGVGGICRIRCNSAVMTDDAVSPQKECWKKTVKYFTAQ